MGDAASAGLAFRSGRAAAGLLAARPRRSSSTRPTTPPAESSRREELSLIAELCQQFNDVCRVATRSTNTSATSTSRTSAIATLPGMAERTVTISGLSKTFSMTGWRLGYCIAPPEITNAIRKVHDFLPPSGAPSAAGGRRRGAGASRRPTTTSSASGYRRRRRSSCPTCAQAGLRMSHEPEGAYYVMTDIAAARDGPDDAEFVRWLIEDVGVSAVPGSSFLPRHATRAGPRCRLHVRQARRDVAPGRRAAAVAAGAAVKPRASATIIALPRSRAEMLAGTEAAPERSAGPSSASAAGGGRREMANRVVVRRRR